MPLRIEWEEMMIPLGFTLLPNHSAKFDAAYYQVGCSRRARHQPV